MARTRSRMLARAVTSAVAAAACTAATGACTTEAFAPGPTDAGAVVPDGALGDGGASCPTNLPGPALAAVPGGYCIDTTEVTFAQYAQFLSAAASRPTPPPGCGNVTSYVPSSGPGPVNPQKAPVVGVDWCDAYVYCAWAGKRLCGAVSGAALSAAQRGDPAADAWYRACTRAGDGAYPYGASYTAGACWDAESSSQPGTCPSPVASKPGCEGGYAGVFDMVGNVREWTNDCEATTGGSDACHSRGGSCTVAGTSQSCAWSTTEARGSSSPHLGVRCCYYPSP